MLHFECDYNKGAHPSILNKLLETNDTAFSGYGVDDLCNQAKEKVKKAFGCDNGDVYFLVGGTQTNQIVIDGLLTGYQGVIAAKTGHINCHEAGAIEYTGHKVLELPEHLGKIDNQELIEYLNIFYGDPNNSHMVQPGMVYISYPTEYGTIYSKKELEELHSICQKYNLPLFIDGARLGYGLMSNQCDIDIKDFANYCDVFYAGGTKVGALIGEAVVFTHHNAPSHFITTVKQHGALLAKGWILGIQFDCLFSDNLYFDISKHAIEMADKLIDVLNQKGYKFFIPHQTNQLFIIVDNQKLEELKDKVVYSFWEKFDDQHTVIRFATSWATTLEDINELASYL